MAELEKRISGDWFELREKAGDFHSLLDTLALSPAELDREEWATPRKIISYMERKVAA